MTISDINVTELQKPVIKWVGGKHKIIGKLVERFPSEINNYHEPFLGGGSILLGLLGLIRQNKIQVRGNIYAYDLNKPLISMHKNIKENVIDLYEVCMQLLEDYDVIETINGNKKPRTEEEGCSSKESYYYWIRKQFNDLEDKTSVLASAYFIFMNKTGFRGMYREGPNGMNVPYGHYVNVTFDLGDFQNVSELYQSVEFIHCDFSEALSRTEPDDFIYLDPPYVPVDDTSFVDYNRDGFGLDQHMNLFTECRETLNDKKFMMSNSNTILVRDNFPEDRFNLILIDVRRAINSVDPGQMVKELLITNY